MLTGRLCWHLDHDTDSYKTIAKEQTFPPLMSDEEANRVRVRLSTMKTEKAMAGRRRRPLSGLVRCAHCGKTLTYIQKGRGTEYLRCNQYECPSRFKYVRADLVFGVLQYALAMHAKTVAPLLGQPSVEPPEVAVLRREIKTLSAISGTDDVVASKEAEILRLLGEDTETPIKALIAALRLPHFWLQKDEQLNDSLRLLVRRVTVDLAENAATAEVKSVECRRCPSEAPLPADQRDVRIPVTRGDLRLAVAAGGSA